MLPAHLDFSSSMTEGKLALCTRIGAGCDERRRRSPERAPLATRRSIRCGTPRVHRWFERPAHACTEACSPTSIRGAASWSLGATWRTTRATSTSAEIPRERLVGYSGPGVTSGPASNGTSGNAARTTRDFADAAAPPHRRSPHDQQRSIPSSKISSTATSGPPAPTSCTWPTI
jgi:hypothetical protein